MFVVGPCKARMDDVKEEKMAIFLRAKTLLFEVMSKVSKFKRLAKKGLLITAEFGGLPSSSQVPRMQILSWS